MTSLKNLFLSFIDEVGADVGGVVGGIPPLLTC